MRVQLVGISLADSLEVVSDRLELFLCTFQLSVFDYATELRRVLQAVELFQHETVRRVSSHFFLINRRNFIKQIRDDIRALQQQKHLNEV